MSPSVVVRCYHNDLAGPYASVEMRPNYVEETSAHRLACKIRFVQHFNEDFDTNNLFMSFDEFQSQLALFVQAPGQSFIEFNIPGFPCMVYSRKEINQIISQDQISECLELQKQHQFG